MDCVRPSDLKDIMAQMDQYEAELEQDIYTFNGGVIDSSAPPLFDQCAPAFGGLINPYNLSRNLAELQAGNSNSCDSAASSEDWRTSNSVNSNDGVQDAAMNPCAAVQAAPPPNYVTASPAMADQGPYASEDGGFGNSGTTAASMAAMREMIFRVAAMQPINIDPETIKRPKRRNVRISKDPLSVAARHRRERISERIRILQRLVPGGTKMDTASMLDEAIHYVKFLKRQVQALEAAAAAGGHFNYPNHNPGLNYSAFSSSPFAAPHFLAAGPNNSSSLRICNTRLM